MALGETVRRSRSCAGRAPCSRSLAVLAVVAAAFGLGDAAPPRPGLERLRRQGQREPARRGGGRARLRALGGAAGARARARPDAEARWRASRRDPLGADLPGRRAAAPLARREARRSSPPTPAPESRSGCGAGGRARRAAARGRAGDGGGRHRARNLAGQRPDPARPDARREDRVPDPLPARALGLPERRRRAAADPLRRPDDPRLAAPPAAARPAAADVDLRAEHRHRRGPRARDRLQPAPRLALPGGARAPRAGRRRRAGDARDRRPDGRVQRRSRSAPRSRRWPSSRSGSCARWGSPAGSSGRSRG